MIAVIADDLTGATELAGLALRYNLQPEVALEFSSSSDADVLVISADTRSKSQDQAVTDIKTLTEEVGALKPELIFKKVDSVLRGYVLPELVEQMNVLNLKRALLVPANPALGRTIQDGTYFINGQPISETGFSKDPEFPIRSSDVRQMLRASEVEVSVCKAEDKLPAKGIVVGEVANSSDLDTWASKCDDSFLAAGGSGFFAALLARSTTNLKKKQSPVPAFEGKKLYVSGTAFNTSSQLIASLASKTAFVNYFPEDILEDKALSEEEVERFARQISAAIDRDGLAFMAIDSSVRDEKGISALELRERTALIVKAVFRHVKINELIIEGGSTASAIFKQLEIKSLFPTNEYAPGVIRCRSGQNPELFITLKPGSYNWPDEIFSFPN